MSFKSQLQKIGEDFKKGLDFVLPYAKTVGEAAVSIYAPISRTALQPDRMCGRHGRAEFRCARQTEWHRRIETGGGHTNRWRAHQAGLGRCWKTER